MVNLEKLLQHESGMVEFKACSRGRTPEGIEKTISAFANTQGGYIVCGVQNDGTPINLDREELDKLQLSITSICSNSFNLPIQYKITIENQVLILKIDEMQPVDKPVFISRQGLNKGTYVRRASSSNRATEEDLKRFVIHAQGGAETRAFPGYHWDKYLDLAMVEKYQKQLNLEYFSTEEFLHKKQAVDHGGNVTLFGLLAFSKDHCLQEITKPTTNVVITRYSHKNKINDQNLAETYSTSKEFDGNAVRQFNQSLQYLIENLSYESVVNPQSGLREDKALIPELVLREVLANSIVHRDYSSYVSAIQVNIFTNRLEFTNLGISLVDIDRLEFDPPATRNPLLTKLFVDFKIVEQQARGIRLIQQTLKDNNLESAKFKNLHSHFKVTLYTKDFVSRYLSIVKPFEKYNLNKRQLTAIIRLNQDLGHLDNKTYREINNMNGVNDTRRARNDLKQLVGLGILYAEGQNKATKYFLRTGSSSIETL